MWYCPSCGASNSDIGGFCTECGLPRPGSAPLGEAPAPTSPQKKKKSLRWLWLLLCLAVLAGAAAVCYQMVHLWAPATCTEPEICRICGKTMGEALGHEIREASCTEPSLCTRCGEEFGPALGHVPIPASCLQPSACERCGQILSPALGHDWMKANYDRPETCSRCGETRGEVLGWIGDLEGVMGEETLVLFGRSESHPFLLNRPMNCARSLSFHLKLTEVEGEPYGEWAIYGRDGAGEWQLLDSFTVTASAFQNYVNYPLHLTGEQSFDALTAVPLVETDYKIRYTFYFDEAQENLG
jgi:hypothetical protein